MHFAPRDVPGGFHERAVVENPTSRTALLGGADDDWGRYLAIHGQERPNDRNKTDPNWMEKYQGVAWHLDEYLLAWFTGSAYWNAGYRQNRARHYKRRWPGDGDAHLHGGGQNMREKGEQVF